MTAPSLDTVVFDSGNVAIGRFRCDVSHPRFRASGPIREAVVVFPRTSVWIRHAGSRPFVADANVVTIYNRAQRYERFPIDASGDHCDWFSLSEPLCREVVGAYSPRQAESVNAPFAFERAPSTAALFSRQRARFLRAAAGRLSALAAEEEVLQLVSDILHLAQAHAGRATLSQVASAVGFASHAHLVRICRRELGIPPTRLRAMLRGEGGGGGVGAWSDGSDTRRGRRRPGDSQDR